MRLYSSHTKNSANSWNYNSIEHAKRRNSAKVGAPPARALKYPDWQVLEARRLIENMGWTAKQVATHMQLPLSYVETLKQYLVRANLTPDPTRMEPYTA